MAWLSGWDQRIKLTVDHTKIDAAISWFPVTVFLDPTHGDCVFDELTADANRFKIAFTKADGETELYGEIEKWDDGNEIAIIHVSRDGWTISDSVDTDFYLYYNIDHANNTTYIGDINSTPGAAVWDSDFMFVCHMIDDTTSTVKDSTSNNYDGTKKGANEPAETVGKIGQCQDFDAIDDYINIGDIVEFDGISTITWEAVVKNNVSAADHVVIGRWHTDAQFQLWMDEGNDKWQGIVSGEVQLRVQPGLIAPSGNWQYLVMHLNNNTLQIYVDLADGGSDTDVAYTVLSSAVGNIFIGADQDSSHHFGDSIDEVRLSQNVRSVSWMKATRNSLWNTLLTYGGEEVSGIVAPTANLYGPLWGPFRGVI